LGAAIYNSANVIRIPHVLIESLEKIDPTKIDPGVASNVMTVSKSRAEQIAFRVGKEAGFIVAPTSGAFVDPSASTSGGGGVAPSSSGDGHRKKKTPKP